MRKKIHGHLENFYQYILNVLDEKLIVDENTTNSDVPFPHFNRD